MKLQHSGKRTILSAAIAGATMAGIPVTAFAQGEAARSSPTALEEIVVMAQRRAENIQDVGISMTALPGDQLRSLNINTALDLTNAVPSIEVIRSYAAPGFNSQITIRGVGQPDFQDTTEATTTAYVDEFYMIGAGQADFLTFDIGRVEVARGPQGTIQGRNATGGSINYYTNRPDLEAAGGRVSASYSEHDTLKTEGYFNLPVTETFGLRAAFATDRSDGYMRNRNATSNWDEGGASEFEAARLQALYEPSDDFSIVMKAEYGAMGPVNAGNEKMYPVGAVPGRVGTYSLPTDAFGQSQDSIGAGSIDVTNADGSNEIESRMRHYSSTINYTASEALSFVLLGGYLRSTKSSIEDCDHTPTNICNFSNKAESEHWLVEGRGLYELEDFRLTFGTNYLDHEIHTQSSTPLFFDPAITPFVTSFYGQAFDDTQTLESYAFFAQAEYDLTEKVTLIAGARYTQDDKELDSRDVETIAVPITTPTPRSIGGFMDLKDLIFGLPGRVTTLNTREHGDLAVFDEGMLNANLQVNYQPSEDVLVYAGYRRGVKSGGFITGNVAGAPPELRPFQEETNNAYEIGVKSTLWDGRAVLNSAVFYYDYEDMQNTSLIGITNVITNNDAEVYGGEVELTVRPVPGLDIYAAVGYLQTEVEDINNPVGAVPLISDNELPIAPEYNGNIRVRYSWNAPQGEFFVQGAGHGRTSMYRDSLNNPSTKIPRIFITDALVGYVTPDERWELQLFLNNVFDIRQPINLFDVSAVANSGEIVYHAPRWFGGRVAVNF